MAGDVIDFIGNKQEVLILYQIYTNDPKNSRDQQTKDDKQETHTVDAQI